MKFKIGDKVCTKKLGLPSVGTITGVFVPRETQPNIAAKIWADVYPDWDKGLLYEVEFDRVQKTMSLEEFERYFVGGSNMSSTFGEDFSPPKEEKALPRKAIELAYANTVPSNYIGVYPEEDLELF